MPETSSVRVMSDDLEAYQSLSGIAVLSFVLGILSLLSFAPFWLFIWLFPTAAIVTGLIALRRIATAPEVWTGRTLAQLGIGLAVACVVLALARDHFATSRTEMYGRIVADRFVDKLKEGDVEGAFWLTLPRESRRPFAGKTADSIDPMVVERYMAFRQGVLPLATSLASRESTIEFDEVEKAGYAQGLDYALVVYRVQSPAGERHILIVPNGSYSHVANEAMWWIKEQNLDYTHGSFEPVRPAGHGHSH